MMLKFIQRDKRPRIANMVLKEKDKVRLTLPDFKTFLQSYNNQEGVELTKE